MGLRWFSRLFAALCVLWTISASGAAAQAYLSGTFRDGWALHASDLNAATADVRAYVNSQLGNALPITGGALTGSLSINSALIAGGAQPSLSGTCATGSEVGGATAGSFVTTSGCSATTVIVSLPAAPNGWICEALDQTTTADKMVQSAQSAASCTLTGTTAASDVIVWQARAY